MSFSFLSPSSPFIKGLSASLTAHLTPKSLSTIFLLSVMNFTLHTTLFELLFFSRFKWKFPKLFGRPKWISNIPGTATVMDDVSVAAIGPFPELNDFNALSAGAPLPFVLRGTPPKCRYWSIQVFLAGGGESVKADTIVCDREFDLDENGEYMLTVGGEKPSKGQWIDSGTCKVAKLFGIRCFMMKNGSGWRAPRVYKDGSLVKFDNCERVAGGPAINIESSTTGSIARLSRSIKFNVALLLALPSKMHTVLLGALGGSLIRAAILGKLTKKYTKMILEQRGLTPNVDVVLPGARASLAGSARHAYFSMTYDCTEGDVEIEGVMEYKKSGKDQWRYCSVTCYDFTSLPVAGYYDDESLTENEEERVVEAGKRKFKVILTTRPTRKAGLNEIDVSRSVKGAAVVRLVYPEEGVLEEAGIKPTIRFVGRQ